MFCTNCGKQTNNNVAFCPSCGTKVSEKLESSQFSGQVASNNNGPYPHITSNKSKKPIVVIMSVILVVLISIFAIIRSNNPKNKIIGRWQNKNETVEFMRNGRFTAGYYWFNGTYDISGDSIVLNSPLLGNEAYTFKIEGDTLTLVDKDYAEYKYVFKRLKW